MNAVSSYIATSQMHGDNLMYEESPYMMLYNWLSERNIKYTASNKNIDIVLPCEYVSEFKYVKERFQADIKSDISFINIREYIDDRYVYTIIFNTDTLAGDILLYKDPTRFIHSIFNMEFIDPVVTEEIKKILSMRRHNDRVFTREKIFLSPFYSLITLLMLSNIKWSFSDMDGFPKLHIKKKDLTSLGITDIEEYLRSYTNERYKIKCVSLKMALDEPLVDVIGVKILLDDSITSATCKEECILIAFFHILNH